MSAGLSQHQLGRRVFVSGDLVGKVEKTVRLPSDDLLSRLDAEFGTDGYLSRLGASIERSPGRKPSA